MTCNRALGDFLPPFVRVRAAFSHRQVAFKEQVGVIHGPVETSFGSHLILITDRE